MAGQGLVGLLLLFIPVENYSTFLHKCQSSQNKGNLANYYTTFCANANQAKTRANPSQSVFKRGWVGAAHFPEREGKGRLLKPPLRL